MKKVIELEREDLDALHDIILEALNYTGQISDDYVKSYWDKLPKDLKEDAERWGLDSTVVRDSIYEWLKENR